MKRAGAALLFAALLGCHGDDEEDAAIAAALSKILPVAESEPNNDAPTAIALSSSGAGRGTIGAGNVDFWWFDAAAGQAVQVEIHGTRLDQATWNAASAVPLFTLFAPDIYLMDTDGTTVSNDDTYYYDSSVQYLVTTPGTYFLNVDEYSGSAGEGYYLLRFTMQALTPAPEVEANDTTGTATPAAYGADIAGNAGGADIDFWSFSGQSGDMVRVTRFDSANRQGSTATISVDIIEPDGVTTASADTGSELQVTRTILQQTGTYFVRVTGGTATDYGLRLMLLRSAAYESEANNSEFLAEALGTAGAGVIGTAGDVDFFRFEAEAGELVRIAAYASTTATDSDGDNEHSGHGSTLSPRLRLYSAAMGLLAEANDLPNVITEGTADALPCAAVAFIAPATGTYYVVVSAASGGGSATDYYVVERK